MHQPSIFAKAYNLAVTSLTAALMLRVTTTTTKTKTTEL